MKPIIYCLLLLNTLFVFGQNREKAFDLNQKLGRGINYGNMFEAPTETDWGNQWQPEYAKMIANLGFNHVRIPIRWEPADRSSATPPYTVNTIFLNRIKQVVDSALNNGLYAIINMHHHEALYENPAQQKARFLAQWNQISAFFSDYPDSLLFEILNEPHSNLTADKWNILLAEALDIIREKDSNKTVLIGTAEYGGLGGLAKLQLPDDDNIILTVHYYNPFSFTHQGADGSEGSEQWLGTAWTDTETERNVVRNDFAALKTYEQIHNIPIHIGEFGSYYKADTVSREKWTTYIARYLETQNWSWAYWEFSAGFGIYNKATQSWNTGLVNALMHNPMPTAAYYDGTELYKSDFAQTISDWDLYNQSGASSAAFQDNDKLNVSIADAGSQNWHVQLVKNNVQLIAGKKYRLSFKAKAEVPRQITAYVGKSASPWTIYSSNNNFLVSDTFAVYTFVFDATTNDNMARIVFDLGNSTNNINFDFVLFEEVKLHNPTSAQFIKNLKSKVYPNPFTNQLTINNQDGFQELTVINMQGVVVKKQQLKPFQNASILANLSSGIYFVMLSNHDYRFTSKIIKK